MLRNLAVLMSALVAMSAQAEDASTPQAAGEPAPAAASAESEQSQPGVVGREPAGSHSPPLSPSTPLAQPDTASDTTTRKVPNNCGMTQSFFDEAPTPVAIRVYEPEPPRQDSQLQAWNTPPSVWKAGRCLQQYVIQLKSESKEPFAVKDVKLVGADGEVLSVIDIRSRLNAQKESINIVTVERTKTVAEPNYRVAVELIGQDGRRFVVENVELP